MKNPLTRVVMNNIAGKKGSIVKRNNNTGVRVTLSDMEEKLLKNVINKGNKPNNTTLSVNSTQNKTYNKGNDYSNNRPGNLQKVKLEDLAKNPTTKRDKPVTERRNKTMMTLNELAGNNKSKTSNTVKRSEKQTNVKKEAYKRNNKNVKSNVIGNLEAYIPKVSLDSIGKKGSLNR